MQSCDSRCYHHIEVKPETIGRVFGTGLRVAGRMAGQRLSAAAEQTREAKGTGPAAAASARAGAASEQVRTARPSSGSLRRGVGGFLKPFKRIGGILWLEVMGALFLLPAVVFAPNLWRTRASYMQGPDHRTFISSAIVVVVFGYLGVSSFWRARRK
jgi:hypothetical protein